MVLGSRRRKKWDSGRMCRENTHSQNVKFVLCCPGTHFSLARNRHYFSILSMIRWHPNKIHFPISSLDTSKLLHIPNALTFGLHFHPSIRFHTAHGCHKNKHNAIRHLFETNNIASTVNKQHQIAFYFVPIHFIFWRLDFDNTPVNRLSSGVVKVKAGDGQDTQVSLSFSSAYIVPYIFCGVCSLVASIPFGRRLSPLSFTFLLLFPFMHFILLSFRSLAPHSLCVPGRWWLLARVQSAICHTVVRKCRHDDYHDW